MDPNEVYQKMIALAGDIMTAGVGQDLEAQAAELAAAVLDMDDWLKRGGFRPDAWSQSPFGRRGG